MSAWPNSTDYSEAVQAPGAYFADPDLKAAEAVCGPMGMPVAFAGNFADVYQLRSAHGSKSWAVKCFTKKMAGLRERYREISTHLDDARLKLTVEFKYLEEGVRIGGEWFPVLKMDWVSGFTLRQFVEENLRKPKVLSNLFEIWLKVEPMLRRVNIAHGDLQHGNVMLVPSSKGQDAFSLRLIDYDGLWVPRLANNPPDEAGHPSYQHPLRRKQNLYTPEIDRFPHLVIACALRCLGRPEGRDLWKAFDSGENLLFARADFETPARSKLLKDLWETNDPELQTWVGHIVTAGSGPLQATQPLQQLMTDGQLVELKPQDRDRVQQFFSSPGSRVLPPASVAQTGDSVQTQAAEILKKLMNRDKPAAPAAGTSGDLLAELKSVPKQVLDLVPEGVVRENLILPVRAAADGSLVVAMRDAQAFDLVQKLTFILNMEVTPLQAPRAVLLQAIEHHFGPAEDPAGALPKDVFLFFTATWSGPCRQLVPIVAKLEKEGLPVRTVDADAAPEFMERFDVKAIPTFLVLVNGQPAQRLVGSKTESELRALVAQSGLAKFLKAPPAPPALVVDLMKVPANVVALVPDTVARDSQIFPIRVEPNGTLVMAVPDARDQGLRDKLRFIFNKEVTLVTVPVNQIAAAIARHYGGVVKKDEAATPRNGVLFFTAKWAAPCRALEPTVAKLQKEGLSIQSIDTDDRADLAKQFGIQTVPTFALVIDGAVTTRKTGALTEDELRQWARRIAPTAPGVSKPPVPVKTTEPPKAASPAKAKTPRPKRPRTRGQRVAWGIDIGQTALKAVCLQTDGESDHPDILAFDYIEYPKILSQPDADSETLIDDAIEALLGRNDFSKIDVCVGTSAQAAVVRMLKLPPVEEKKIGEIVKFEARQQIPFALDEVNWDYQQLSSSAEEDGFILDAEVVLVAVKRETVTKLLVPFVERNLEVAAVQLGPLALLNGMLNENVAGSKDADQYEALLDIGTESSALMFTNGQTFWQRSIPLGGNHFTKALTKEFKLTFAKAEHLKRNVAKSPDLANVLKALRPVLNDFVTELQRSVGYFTSVNRKAKVTKVHALGNSFKLPGLQKYLAQHLAIDVEKVPAFRQIQGPTILQTPAFAENLLTFGTAYGLALQPLEMSTLTVSLAPPKVGWLERAKRSWFGSKQ